MKTILLITILLISNLTFSQNTVTVQYKDGSSNNYCIISSDTSFLGYTNRNGEFTLNSAYLGKLISIEDLSSAEKHSFTFTGDTIVQLGSIQTMDELEINPIDKKKLNEEIIKINKNRLPEKLNIKGQFYYTTLNVVYNSSSKSLDTLYELFTCDIIVLDAYGTQKILIKDSKKMHVGDLKVLENQTYIASNSKLTRPLKEIDNQLSNILNYNSPAIKKYKKFSNRLVIEENTKSLIFSKLSNIGQFDSENKIEYTWDKNDSTLLNSTFYFNLDSKTGLGFSSPYTYTELSNRNKDYSNAFIIMEQKFEITAPGTPEMINCGSFVGLFIDSQIPEDYKTKKYKTIEDLEEFVNEIKAKDYDSFPSPKVFPSHFPLTVIKKELH